MSSRAKPIKHRFDPGKDARTVGDMLSVVGNESGVELIRAARRAVASFGRQRALDHALRSTADQRTRGVETHRRQAVPGERKIEGIDQIGSGIDECPVQIENKGQHGFA